MRKKSKRIISTVMSFMMMFMIMFVPATASTTIYQYTGKNIDGVPNYLTGILLAKEKDGTKEFETYCMELSVKAIKDWNYTMEDLTDDYVRGIMTGSYPKNKIEDLVTSVNANSSKTFVTVPVTTTKKTTTTDTATTDTTTPSAVTPSVTALATVDPVTTTAPLGDLEPTGTITLEQQFITATQLMIWRHTNGVTLNFWDAPKDDPVQRNLRRICKYLDTLPQIGKPIKPVLSVETIEKSTSYQTDGSPVFDFTFNYVPTMNYKLLRDTVEIDLSKKYLDWDISTSDKLVGGKTMRTLHIVIPKASFTSSISLQVKVSERQLYSDAVRFNPVPGTGEGNKTSQPLVGYVYETLEASTDAAIELAPVTTAPVTTAPVTTAPVTTAPVTTAPVTTAPVTTEPPVTTAPPTTAPVTSEPPVTTAPPTTAPATSEPPVTTAPPTTAPVTSEPPTTTASATELPPESPPGGGVITGDTNQSEDNNTTNAAPPLEIDNGIIPGGAADTLVQTGGIPSTDFYYIGAGLVVLGLLIWRQSNSK